MEIKAAFRRLAMTHHPDRPGGSNEKFQLLRNAYEALSSVEDIRIEDALFSEYESAVASGSAQKAWKVWDLVMNRAMPVDHDMFALLFQHADIAVAKDGRCVLVELSRARECGVLSDRGIEEVTYNEYLRHCADRGKDGIDRAMEVINTMDRNGLAVDQEVARQVFSYMSGVS